MEYINNQLNIVVLQGSVRKGNFTAKAVGVLDRAARRLPGVDFEVVDPTGLQLALPGREITDDVVRLQQKIKEADAVILATPEYHGSYSSVMKLMIDNLGFPSVLKDKPTALLGVAAGRIGAIKALEHLRSVASHVGALVLPEVVSIARVRDMFDKHDRLVDTELKMFVESLLENLIKHLSSTHASAAQICAYSKN